MGRYRIGNHDEHPDTSLSVVKCSDGLAMHRIATSAPAYLLGIQSDGTPVLVPSHSSKPYSSLRWGFAAVLVAIAAQLILWYGPPAPPIPDKSWGDFWVTELGQLIRSLSSLLSVVPHVSWWCWRGVQDDVTELLKKKKSSTCRLELDGVRWSQAPYVVGQDRAVQVVTQAMQMWKSDQTPLALILAGTVGVGKNWMAEKITESLSCYRNDKDDMVLRVDGSDYSKRFDLVEEIQQRYTHRRLSGCIVVIHHAEKMAQGLLSNLLQNTSLLPNLLLVLTTHVGSLQIHRHLKDNGTLQAQSSKLDRILRDEMDNKFGTDLSSYPAVVAPFIPVGHAEMSLILQQQAEKHLQVELTPALANAWTSSTHIEYVQWGTPKPILIFSSRGAKDLEKRQLAQLKASLEGCRLNEVASGHSARADWEHGEAVIQSCHEDEENQEQLVCEEVCRFEVAS